MSTATLSSKGQVTIPKDVRDDLGLTTGSKVMFVKLSNNQYRIVPRTGHVSDLIGMLHDPGSQPLTLAEIDEAIADGGAASGMRGLRQ
ncbi:MAG: AbrB/MazE/SpoVT family DNA-binding domain-containing protein [Micropruina sp.]|uniref:AbrB/MazE/SpoVT family DNA-binding domain-containing protein n=1 Tax=Micropruina sp. TaxID=2737536 RepID=UPI0039E51DD3